MRKVITIDGPGGVGKGTISELLARELGFVYLDSGALYRLAALEVARLHLEDADAAAQASVASKMQIAFEPKAESGMQVLLNGRAIGEELRTEATGTLASKLAAKPEIRAALLKLQQEFGDNRPLVADGRDMGTVVFPHAKIKIFLDADSDVRAERRYKQLKAKGENVNLAALKKEIAERDARDRNRSVAPLKPASDAVVIDTTELSVNAVLEQVKSLISARFE